MFIGIEFTEQGVEFLMAAFRRYFAQFFYRAGINFAALFGSLLAAAAVLQIGIGAPDIARFFDVFRQRRGLAAFMAAEIGDFALPFAVLLAA